MDQYNLKEKVLIYTPIDHHIDHFDLVYFMNNFVNMAIVGVSTALREMLLYNIPCLHILSPFTFTSFLGDLEYEAYLKGVFQNNNIQLDDQMNECRKAERSIRKSIQELQKAFQGLDLKINI